MSPGAAVLAWTSSWLKAAVAAELPRFEHASARQWWWGGDAKLRDDRSTLDYSALFFQLIPGTALSPPSLTFNLKSHASSSFVLVFVCFGVFFLFFSIFFVSR